jgi:hypothetical protein
MILTTIWDSAAHEALLNQGENMTKSKTHALNRTSIKGGPFIGTCTQCGQTGLPSSAVFDYCENTRGITQDEALIEAIDPPPSQQDIT